jgi:hypothetical protein
VLFADSAALRSSRRCDFVCEGMRDAGQAAVGAAEQLHVALGGGGGRR